MVVLDLWDQQEDADAISRRRERLTDLALALEVAWFDPLHIGLIVDGPVRSGGSGVLGGVVVQLCRTGVGTCGGTATTADQAGPLPSARANGYVELWDQLAAFRDVLRGFHAARERVPYPGHGHGRGHAGPANTAG